ncbi:MAG TPA: MBL fold metallo-hydrolase [Vicinamibacterales bacterium]|nr:MBL fold metallo-hydrolase [Vicinamibacterales bacterium]
MTFIDLKFLGLPRVIGSAVLEGPAGLVLIDPGPTSCLPALESGLADHGHRLKDVRTLLLTHIHLDHAGATGTLMDRFPELTAYVHARGAPHMIDPAKLLASATRLYGLRMNELWGEFKPVPADRLHILNGGERLEVAGRSIDVAYTPGHASHHVSYFDLTNGDAFVGDTVGIRVAGNYIKAPTPPPDIDLEAWERSLQVIEAWRPRSLVLTHFGIVDDVAEHLRKFRMALERSAALVRRSLDSDGNDEERIRRFSEDMRAEVRQVLSEADARSTEAAAPFDQLWQGLARYWRKRAA